ncbi:DoxX family membrane protein [Sporosarcina sp. Marseille-Q4063]|uniref:DoxX family membrane protein n=1 Tax=Sporosarcina sp. Marseille-Q4063 TaxID=2810514 RepID=UPI001BB08AE5|nr:DoxX family membrane protein [Sporosarcina sp. Marseille-Q4063]QUW23547.1 DoxX family membrane protein [Sporosarcina sp. Marseille-Q4063]
MAKAFLYVARVFLGVVFLAAGVNGYFVIIDLEPFIATSPEAMALFEFKYLLIFEKSLEIICGLLLLLNQFVPLAISILTPIIVNIFLLHLFLDHSLLLLAALLLIMHGYMLFYYRENFMRILEKKPSS